ncbi:MAG TPA: hypothetical protein VK095_03260 [Beutenbergiaceae bacterium]|nr:hypothetical protein [Beutenbergiaceae bacterium]
MTNAQGPKDKDHTAGANPAARGAGATPQPPRPKSLIAAAVMSWLGSVVLLFIGGTILASRQELLAGLEDQVGAGAAAAINGIGGFMVGTALVVIALSVFAFLGGKWAVWALILVAMVFILFCLIGVVTGAVAMLVPVLWTATAVVLYLLPPSGDWFRAHRSARLAR